MGDRKEIDRRHSAKKYAEFRARRDVMIEKLGGICYACGSTSPPHFHHIEYGPESSYPRNAKSGWVRWKRLKEAEEFPHRFRLLCPRCHQLVSFLEVAIKGGMDVDRLVECLPS